MDVQVAIIGGGPAGTVCAAELARRSIDVVVIESRPFPRLKTCGEFLSPPGVAILSELLDPQALLKAGARPVERIEIWAGSRRLLNWPIGGDLSASRRQGWSLSRETLDTLLLKHAAAAGACVLQPQLVRGVMYGEQGVKLDLGDRELRADCVIHADGSGRHDPAGTTPARWSVVAAKAHFRLPVPLQGILQLHGFNLPISAAGQRATATGRGYFGLVDVEGGVATLAMVVDRAAVRALAGDFDALLNEIWPAAAQAARVSPWHSCPVAGSAYVSPGHPRSFRIGNAAAAVEPVGGEGIGLALWAGSLLGRTLAIDRLVQTQQILARAYRQRLRLRRPVCRMMAGMLAHPGLLALLTSPLARRPGLALGPLYRWSGKMDPA